MIKILCASIGLVCLVPVVSLLFALLGVDPEEHPISLFLIVALAGTYWSIKLFC